MVIPERAPCSIVVSSAAPRPLPETSAIRNAVRKKGLLDVAGDAELLLEALALALIFDQARVVQNTGGLNSEGVQDLTVEFGESGGVAGIQVDNAQKVPGLEQYGLR